MSLQGSPRLELDLRGRRWDGRVAWLALILTPALLLLALSFPLAVCVAALATVLAAGGLYRAGWLGGRDRIQRAVWSCDGRWLLTDGRGCLHEGELRVDSRVGARLVWLRWNANRTRSMLLVSGDVEAAELRRLIVRLRIEGARRALPGREHAVFVT
jgi:hypothetical protein